MNNPVLETRRANVSNSPFQTLYFSLLLIVQTIFIVSGCQFAYYNVYYNAEKNFEEARDIGLDNNGRPSSQAHRKYSKAIEKCEIILEEYPESEWVDDALFMLGRCHYYQQRKTYEAIKKFEELIEFFPDSPLVPQAMLYIARSRKQLHRDDAALSDVQKLLTNSDYREYHPQALSMIADWYIEDEDYGRAEIYLQRILTDFPDSDEYENAYLLLARTFQGAEEYLRSNAIIDSMLADGVSRRTALDARFLMATNNLMLEQYQIVLDETEELLDDEYDLEKIPRIQILQARAMAWLGETDEAIGLFERIVEDNNRSLISAEASFYLAEVYFTILLDYDNARTWYNRVSSEESTSKYVQQAKSRSSVASQILQFQDEDRQISTKDLVSEHFKLAEYYLYELDMPDSSLVVYQRIRNQKDRIIHRKDSLQTMLDTMVVDTSVDYRARIDSLEKVRAEFLEKKRQESGAVDSIDTDTREEIEREYSEITSLLDSLRTLQRVSGSALVKRDSLENRLIQMQQDIEDYNLEYVPRTYFISQWIYQKVLKDSTAAVENLELLQEQFPGNIYTSAAEKLYNGEEIVMESERLREAESRYQSLIEEMETEPDSVVTGLERMLGNYPEINDRILFSLGYTHFFYTGDSLQAKTWFDSLLAVNKTSDYANFIRKFYQNGEFLHNDRLSTLDKLDEKERQEKEEAIEPDEEQSEGESGSKMEASPVKDEKSGEAEKPPHPDLFPGGETGKKVPAPPGGGG